MKLSQPIRRHEFYALVEQGEGLELEFKHHFSSPEKIAKEIIAFANTRGGVVLFGVDDDGTVVGVRSEKSELEEIMHTAEFLCDPPVQVHVEYVNAGGGMDVVMLRVPESTQKPHRLIEFEPSTRRNAARGPGYVRVGEHSVQASNEVMRILEGTSPEGPSFTLEIGANERALFRYLEKHSRITLAEFADLVNISRRRASRILVDLVRANVILLHRLERAEFYTLTEG